MKGSYLKLVAAIIAGFVTLNILVEAIEFCVVLLTSGESVQKLRANQELYFEIRNRPVILVGKMGYTFLASMLAALVASAIAGIYRRAAVVVLTISQVVILIWAGFYSNIGSTGPKEMWIGLCFAVAVGLNMGYKTYVKRYVSQRHPKD